jgi:hypothetical protein
MSKDNEHMGSVDVSTLKKKNNIFLNKLALVRIKGISIRYCDLFIYGVHKWLHFKRHACERMESDLKPTNFVVVGMALTCKFYSCAYKHTAPYL